MGVLKTFTDELRRVQAERETQDLLEALRRRLDVLTFGDLAGLITSALGKKLAAVKVSALLGPSDLAGLPLKTPATATTTKPAKKPRPAAGKKATRKSKAKVKSKAKAASKQKAQPSKKAASRRTSAKSKKAAAESSAPTSARSSALLAAQEAVLRTLAASVEPLGIRGVLAGAKLSHKQANRTLRRLIESGAVQAIGPKQRATYTLAQGTGAVAPQSSPAPSPADAPVISKASKVSKAAGSAARVSGKTTAGREAYAGAILTALQGAGDWIGAADVRAKVGGTPEQMRQGLLRLVSAGAIVKTGERNNTRYKLAG